MSRGTVEAVDADKCAYVVAELDIRIIIVQQPVWRRECMAGGFQALQASLIDFLMHTRQLVEVCENLRKLIRVVE